MSQRLSASLAENLRVLEEKFGDSADYYAKKLRFGAVPAAIVMFDGISSVQNLWNILLDAASGTWALGGRLRLAKDGAAAFALLLHASDLPAEPAPVADWPAAVRALTAGMALVLLDGCPQAIAFSVQSFAYRAVSAPSAEGNLRGSREGFTELLRVNISLLRRLIRTDTLVIEAAQCDTATRTEYALCYVRGAADPEKLEKLRRRLQSARPPVLLDSSYFAPWLRPEPFRLFSPFGYTERPAVAAAKLCEGKAVILVNGSPSAMIVPYLFAENFECLDDYGGTAYFATLLRLLNMRPSC